MPVHLRQGDQDASVSLAMGRYLERMIPGTRFTICLGEGHLEGLTHWEEIVRWCTE